MNQDQTEAAFKLQADYLKKQTDEIIRLVTSKEFLERATAVLSEDRERQLELASETMTPEALADAGLAIPDGLRISSRYFEEGERTSTTLGSSKLLTDYVKSADFDAVGGDLGRGDDAGGPMREPGTGPRFPGRMPGDQIPGGFPRRRPRMGDPVRDPEGNVAGNGPATLPDDAAKSLCICVGAGGCIGIGGG